MDLMNYEKEEVDDDKSSSNNKRSGSPTTEGHGALKRFRPTEKNNHDDEETRPLILPPEMWAGVMECELFVIVYVYLECIISRWLINMMLYLYMNIIYRSSL